MSIASTIPLADGVGMHSGNGGWWILGAVLMMLFMGGMMWMMMRGMGGSSSPPSSPSPEGPATKESPVEVLDRRFAEGEVSEEDYRARRKILLNATAESNGAQKDEALSAAGGEERNQ